MTIYPAIDLRNGKCVRLYQGKAEAETIYYDDPLIPAMKWKGAGAKFLHLIDLDGAFSGNSTNLDAVKRIVKESGLQVQLGGGMRDESSISRALELGLSRIIIGTRACETPDWISSLLDEFGPEKIVIGIDAKDGMVTTKGWVEKTEVGAIDLARRLTDLGIKWIIHTDIATDGAMLGPNLEAQRKMAEAIPTCNLIASGGVSKQKDIDNLSIIARESPNLEGVIIGKALYEGTIELGECFNS